MKLKEFEDKYNNIIAASLAVIFVLIFSVFAYTSEYLYNHESFTLPVYRLSVICLTVFLGLFACYMKNKIYSIEKATFLSILILGLAANFIFTPFSVPDEYTHFYSAYHTSNLLMFRFDDLPTDIIMRTEDALFTQNIHIISRSQYMKLLGEFHVFCEAPEMIHTGCGYLENKFFLYLPAAIGVTIGRLLHLSAYVTFNLGRITSLLFFAFGTYLAMWMMPYGKKAVAAIALLPMSLHIAASYSYDVFSAVGVMIIFAYIMHIMYGEKKIGWKEIAILAAMIAFVIPYKVVYIGVAAIVLLVPRERFEKPKLHFVIKCGLGIVGVLSIFVLQFANTAKIVGTTDVSESTSYTIPYILANFPEFVRLMLKSTIHFADYYTKGMVAYFGWFQIEMPWFLTISVLVFLFLSFMKMHGEPKAIGGIGRIYSLLLFVAIYAVTMLLLLMDHTPMGSQVILGVQGRYFIAGLPLLYVALRNNTVVLEPNGDKMVLFGMTCADVLILIYTLARALAQ